MSPHVVGALLGGGSAGATGAGGDGGGADCTTTGGVGRVGAALGAGAEHAAITRMDTCAYRIPDSYHHVLATDDDTATVGSFAPHAVRGRLPRNRAKTTSCVDVGISCRQEHTIDPYW